MIRPLLLCLALLTPVPGLAALPDTLPVESPWKAEVRRGPDGRLTAVPMRQSGGPGADAAPPQATMVVGPGERVTSITEAAQLARNGEVVEIRPGEYHGQPAVWTQDKLLIRGAAGGRPVMLADGRSAEGKAIWVVRGGRVDIDNIEFRGARVPTGNGAGIRFEGGQLVVRRSAFVDNENGILTANQPDMTLEVYDSRFGAAPQHAGMLHHLLYVGAIGRFVLEGSHFEQGYLGHLVKSRARENLIRYNQLVDGAGGRASYELEFPDGGVAHVIGNVIGQSAETDNPVLISYGAESARWPDNALFLAHNTLLNDARAGSYLKVWHEKFPGGVETWLINNLSIGYGDVQPPPLGRFEGNKRAERRDLPDDGSGQPLRLRRDSPLRGSVRLPGPAQGVDLLPTAEFFPPAGRRAIHPSSTLAPGAFQ